MECWIRKQRRHKKKTRLEYKALSRQKRESMEGKKRKCGR
jgi:hypothetical protein